MIVLSGHEKGQSPTIGRGQLGLGLIFERLWTESGCRAELKTLLRERNFLLDVERVMFVTVLTRLLHLGSDRQWERHFPQAYARLRQKPVTMRAQQSKANNIKHIGPALHPTVVLCCFYMTIFFGTVEDGSNQ